MIGKLLKNLWKVSNLNEKKKDKNCLYSYNSVLCAFLQNNNKNNTIDYDEILITLIHDPNRMTLVNKVGFTKISINTALRRKKKRGTRTRRRLNERRQK